MKNSKWQLIGFGVLCVLLFCSCSDKKNDENSTVIQNPGDLQTVIFRRVVNNQADIYMVKEDGSQLVALANGADDERYQGITPAGNLIYSRYINGVQGELFSINKNGGNPVAITDTLGLDGSKTFSAITPGGKIIFFNKPVLSSYDLYMINADGTGLITISAGPYDDTFRGFTPSGWILFDKYHYDQNPSYIIEDIYAINEAGDEQHTIANSSNIDLFRFETNDGRIIYHSWPSGYSITNSDVYSVNLDGTDRQILANSSVNEFGRGMTTTNQVIIEKETAPYQWDLYSVNTDGTGWVALAEDPNANEFFVATTSTGRVIYNQNTLNDLYSINADGTDLQPIANSTDREFFQTLTSNEQVIYRRAMDNTQDDLFVVNPDGSGNLRLTETVDKSEQFIREAANGRIIFQTLSTTYPIVYGFSSINVDGTGLATLIADTSNAVYFIDETPSGRLIFVEQDGSGLYNMYSVDTFGNGLVQLADKVDRSSFKGETANGRIIIERRSDPTSDQYDIISVKADGTDLKMIASSVDDERFEAIH